MQIIKLPKRLFFEYMEIADEELRPFPEIIKETKQNIFVERVYADALRSLYYEAQYWASNYSICEDEDRRAIQKSAMWTVKAIQKYYLHFILKEDWNNCFDSNGKFIKEEK